MTLDEMLYYMVAIRNTHAYPEDIEVVIRLDGHERVNTKDVCYNIDEGTVDILYKKPAKE